MKEIYLGVCDGDLYSTGANEKTEHPCIQAEHSNELEVNDSNTSRAVRDGAIVEMPLQKEESISQVDAVKKSKVSFLFFFFFRFFFLSFFFFFLINPFLTLSQEEENKKGKKGGCLAQRSQHNWNLKKLLTLGSTRKVIPPRGTKGVG